MSTLRLSLDKQMKEWGFNNLNDFFQSAFHSESFITIFVTSVSLTALGEIIREIIGFTPMVYVSFIVLLLVEVVTGIRASLLEGEKINSKRFGRFILKTFVYTIMLGITNVFGSQIEGFTSYIYNTIHMLIFDYITLQLIISVFENLSRMGYQESSSVFNGIHKVISKYIKLNDKK
jgi:hypothetical protein